MAVKCPNCGSENIDFQVHEEKTTVTRTKSKYKEKGHGCLWWLLIGWWWWIVDLMLWIFLFLPRLVIQLCKKKKYKGSATSVSADHVNYQTICLCKDCGHNWKK